MPKLTIDLSDDIAALLNECAEEGRVTPEKAAEEYLEFAMQIVRDEISQQVARTDRAEDADEVAAWHKENIRQRAKEIEVFYMYCVDNSFVSESEDKKPILEEIKRLFTICVPIRSTLPDDLRQRGSALYTIEFTDDGATGKWTEVEQNEPVRFHDHLCLVPGSGGQVHTKVEENLMKGFLSALREGEVNIPGFRKMGTLADNSLLLEWSHPDSVKNQKLDQIASTK